MRILGPESSRAIAPGVQWWICECGRQLDDHSQRTRPNTGGREIVCSLTDTGRFMPADARWNYDENGLSPRPPAAPPAPPVQEIRPPIARQDAARDLEIRADEFHTGITGCRLFVNEDGGRCQEPAVLLWDVHGERGIPACASCADALLERVVALELWPAEAVNLAPLRSW